MSAAWYEAMRRSARITIVVGVVVTCVALAFYDWRASLLFFGVYLVALGNAQDINLTRQQRRDQDRAAEARRNRRVEL